MGECEAGRAGELIESLNVGLGILVGLILGIALVWTRDQLDSTVKTPDDVEQKLGVTFLGLLPEQSDGSERKRGAKRRRRQTRTHQAKFPVELTVH